MELEELYSEIIKDHNMSRHNKHGLGNSSISVPGRNPSCGDEIELSLRVEDGKIADASYTGDGCAISQASVSIMIDLVRGRTLEEAEALCSLFLDMIRKGEMSQEEMGKLEEAAALAGIAKMPARVKCATMPWHTLKSAVEKFRKTQV